jgi:hypothetical protein
VTTGGVSIQPGRTPTALVIGGWLLIQTAMLAWGAPARWWPHHPMPPQTVAVEEMVCLQIFLTALFSPLIDRWDRALMLIAGAAFFQQATAILAAVPVGRTGNTTLGVTAWIIGAALPRKSGRAAVLPFVLAAIALVPELINFGTLSKAVGAPDAAPPQLIVGPIEEVLRQSDGLKIAGLAMLLAPGFLIRVVEQALQKRSELTSERAHQNVPT